MTYKFHPENILPTGDWIWVFPSNEAGKHARGLARMARVNFRAEFGVGSGRTGNAFAIPVRDKHNRMLPLNAVADSIAAFLDHARHQPQLNFFIPRIGCAAGEFSDDQIGPLFARASENCSLPQAWMPYVAQARSKPRPPAALVSAGADPAESRERGICPFCGRLTWADAVEPPSDYCHHEVLKQ